MTDSFFTRCAVLQGMFTWALGNPRPIYGIPKRNSGVSFALIRTYAVRRASATAHP
jgi:hypothetical protein